MAAISSGALAETFRNCLAPNSSSMSMLSALDAKNPVRTSSSLERTTAPVATATLAKERAWIRVFPKRVVSVNQCPHLALLTRMKWFVDVMAVPGRAHVWQPSSELILRIMVCASNMYRNQSILTVAEVRGICMCTGYRSLNMV